MSVFHSGRIPPVELDRHAPAGDVGREGAFHTAYERSRPGRSSLTAARAPTHPLATGSSRRWFTLAGRELLSERPLLEAFVITFAVLATLSVLTGVVADRLVNAASLSGPTSS